MNRTLAVARMYTIDKVSAVVMPFAILASAFAINLFIWRYLPEDGRTTGGALSLPIFVLVAALVAVARGLAFSLSLGSSRRAFALGTGLTAALTALAFGSFLSLMSLVETATDGWGMSGHFFWFPWFDRSTPAGVWLMLVAVILVMFIGGAFTSAVWVRWGNLGMYVAMIATVLIGGGTVALVTRAQAWAAVGQWFAALTPLTTAGWLLALSVVLGGAGYAAVRRTSV